MNKLVSTAFVALLAPGMAHAFCPTPKVLQPGPGEVTGCPVYAKTNNGKFWWSDSVDAPPYDNNLYGVPTNTNGVDRSNEVNQITAIVAANWTLESLGYALIPVTFTPTTTQFSTSDGQPAILITDDGIKQSFLAPDAVCQLSAVLKPEPGQVAGCPTYVHTTPGKVWWRLVADNNLYGVLTTVADATDRKLEANQITAIAAHNWTLTQLSNAWGVNFPLAPVKFTLTNRQFATPDFGAQAATIIQNDGIAQGF